MSLKEQVAESAEWCVGVKVHPASLASPSAHTRSSSLRRPRRIELEAFATAAHSAGHIPGCPKGSRPLTSSAPTLTLISVVFARLRQLRGVSGTEQGCPQTETSVLSATTARESTLTRHVKGLSFERLPNRSSLRFLAADTVRTVASHSLLEHHHHRLQAQPCVVLSALHVERLRVS